MARSYVCLARVPGSDGTPVEWVTEDAIAIQENGGDFPSPPGAYYCEVTSLDPTTGKGEFMVDPLIDSIDEKPVLSPSGVWRISHPCIPQTLRVYGVPEGGDPVPLDFSASPDGTGFSLMEEDLGGMNVSVDYRYVVDSTGPWPFSVATATARPIPGVSLAFGYEASIGDRFVVLVSKTREDMYEEYGGRFDLSFDIDITTRDPTSRSRIADRTFTFLVGVFRPGVADMGLEVSNVSLGGDSEDVYNDTGDESFYKSSITLQIQTDWAMFVPCSGAVRTVISRTGIPNLSPYEDPFYTLRERNFPSLR